MKYGNPLSNVAFEFNLRRYNEGDAHVGLDFEIRNTYPPVAYVDDGVTLRAAGLTPNAALLLKPVSPPGASR